MFEYIQNIKLTEAIYGISAKPITVSNRKTSIFVVRTSGKCIYGFGNQRVVLEVGEGILLPAGSSYWVKSLSEEPSRYALIRFSADIEDTWPVVFNVDSLSMFMDTFRNLSRYLLFEDAKRRYLSLSLFYKILSMLSPKSGKAYLNSKKIAIIQPALQYLEEHIFDPELVVGNLHLLCGISNVYFSKLFMNHTGKQVGKYVTEIRLNRAKSILDNKDYVYVRDVANAVGYTDALYFSRIFKQYYGLSPSHYVCKNL